MKKVIKKKEEEKEKTKPPDWIFPWELRKVTHAPEDMQSLRYGLRRDGLSLDADLSKYRDKEGRNVTHTLGLLDALWPDQWILALSNSAQTLEAIAALLPVTFALTTLRTVRVVSTEKLITHFQTRRPGDDFADDPAGEYLHALQRARLVVWDHADFPASTGRYAGAFATLLTQRTSRMTLFLATATASEKALQQDASRVTALQMLDKHLTEGLGRSAVQLIEQQALHVHILVPEVQRRYVAWR